MKPDGGTTLVIGSLEIARGTCAALRAHEQRVIHLLQPTETDIRAAISAGVTAVAIVVRGDVTALRYALFVEHLLPEVPLIVTLFDRTVAGNSSAPYPIAASPRLRISPCRRSSVRVLATTSSPSIWTRTARSCSPGRRAE
ncbi:hypothetical protein [Nocardia sp. NPDC051750]|uniref:hypothetical protein n=1 Tax=Nocardia sp. NPDC051750 TaxID=3364325 RepID=UPI0037887400